MPDQNKILFFQWRYHTNRHPMVKGLIDRGYEVKYISQYSLPSRENHSEVEPVVIGYSPVFKSIAKKLGVCNHRTKKSYGWPPLGEIYHEIKSFDPDIIIVRDHKPVTYFILLLGKLLGADGIVQEQIPMYSQNPVRKYAWFGRIYKAIFRKPLPRVTPIRGDDKNGKRSPATYYIPFPVDLELYQNSGKKERFRDGKINIISVGTLSMPRKNQIDLLRSINELRESYDVHLTLVGHLSDTKNNHYQQILSFIRSNDLEESTEIRINMDHDELQREYKNYDLFVLPSRDEPAAVSPVEAMAGGLPVICSDSNGTKEYINEGENGAIFVTGSQDDLTQKIEYVIEDKQRLIRLSEKAVETVKQNHSPESYAAEMENIFKSITN